MSMITASLWVPRGAPATFPQKYDIDELEIARISNLAKLKLEDAKEELENKTSDGNGAQDASEDSDTSMGDEDPTSPQHETTDDDLKDYDLDHYDDDDDETGAKHENKDVLTALGNIGSLAYYGRKGEDPYISNDRTQDDEEEREELQVLATDSMVVAAKVEDEVPYLEIYIYEDEADNLYVHHDIMLPSVPLCVEWIDLPVEKADFNARSDDRGNFVAVGMMDPDIELWDLDTVDSMYPNAILGPNSTDGLPLEAERKAKKKKRKKARPHAEYHTDAVLALSINRKHRNLLASASADTTVKLWNLSKSQCASSYEHHSDKVCAVQWHPQDDTTLLTGGYDRRVFVIDARAPNVTPPMWAVESDVETVQWNPHESNLFFVATENGMLHMHDRRMPSAKSKPTKAVWSLQAHDGAASSLDVNPVIPGFLATGSSDKEVKLWDIQGHGPSMVTSRNLGVGRVFSTRFAPDAEVAFRLSVSGSEGALQVWDTSTNAGVRGAFAHRPSMSRSEQAADRVIGIPQDDSESEEEASSAQVGDVWESVEENDGP